MSIIIRPAIKEDCGQLMELVNELALFEKAQQEVTVKFEHFVESGFGDNPVWWAFVAAAKQADGTEKIVAFALYYVRYSTWRGQRMYLEDIIVTEKWRGKGVGKLLFDRLLAEAKEKNFTGMTWQVLDWNEPAIEFYKKYEAQFETGWVNCNISFKAG